MKEKVILLKVGEIYLKGKNRNFFEEKLKGNIEKIVQIPKNKIKKISEGVFELAYQRNIFEKLDYIFGIARLGEYFKFSTFAELEKNLIEEFLPTLLKEKNFKSLKVEASRENKKFPLNSIEIQKHLGEKIILKFPEIKIDLKNPQLRILVEVRQKGFYLSSNFKEKSGLGGLPIGVSGRGLALISGGIDSPVAAFLMMKRGVQTDFIYFHSPPFVGNKTKEKIIDIGRVLKRYLPEKIKIYIPYFTDLQVKIKETIKEPFWTIFYRRYMFKIAEIIAEKERYHCLISGDNLSQVASQTIENLIAESFDIKKIIFRPLISFDKRETIEIAKKVGTYPLSILPFEDCCALFSPRNPETKATIEKIKGEEEKIKKEVGPLITESLQKTETILL